MAIGTTAAILGSAALGAGASALSASQASKAQSKSASASQQATDTATAEQRRQYDLSRGDNAPWLQTGQNALAQLGSLYGLGGGQQAALTQPMTQPMQQAPMTGGYGGYMPSDATAARLEAKGVGGNNFAQMMALIDSGQLQGDPVAGVGQVGTGQVGQAQLVPYQAALPMNGPAPAAGQPNGMAGFFQSPDYQFRLNESMRALTARNAALGTQDSGAAQRSALTLAGNQASGEFNNYANRLSALAGVGQTAAAQNQSLGQNYAGAVGNLAVNNAQNLASSYQNQAAIGGQLAQQFAGIGSGLLMNKRLF